ncbi:hypothetical protein RHMOL_Rhmol11G0014200 [Rhododendron molle]|uniref:Uncharacterized protein n=1 Tax=Rhododendron molle TaxID=49168 RepID=A0ACC0LMT9_RHOML|nr:hypothetical protein RHMOL_Rhmol11G0014200 [Rhododendron molle]
MVVLPLSPAAVSTVQHRCRCRCHPRRKSLSPLTVVSDPLAPLNQTPDENPFPPTSPAVVEPLCLSHSRSC